MNLTIILYEIIIILLITIFTIMNVFKFTGTSNLKQKKDTLSEFIKSIITMIIFISCISLNVYIAHIKNLDFYYFNNINLNNTILLLIIIIGIFHCVSLIVLGSNWSDSEVPNKDSNLIIKGPYSIVRNPVYTCFFSYGLLTLLASPYLLVLGLMFIIVPLYRLIVAKEEKFLEEIYKQEYINYKKKVKYKMIPFIF